jgi:DNA-binding transcriptional LysR family regulator
MIEIVDVSGPLTTDNVATANAAVAAGAGIGIAQHWQVQELLAQDRCTLLRTQYGTTAASHSCNLASGEPPSPTHARRYIDFLAVRLPADFRFSKPVSG